MKNFVTLTKFEQFAEFLAEEISKGIYKPGDKIPSERDLGKRHGMSHMTVNKAVANLVAKGILERDQGNGTFVAYPKQNLFQQMLVICIDHETNIHSKFPGLFHKYLDKDKYITTFYDVYNLSNSRTSLESILEEKPRALIIDAFSLFPFETLKKVSEETQLIFIHRYEAEKKYSNASYILGHRETAGYLATKELINQGCKKIAVFSFEYFEHLGSGQYYRGHLKAMEEAGLKPYKYMNTDIADEADYLELLKPENRPDGIMTQHDYRILPFIKLMKKSNLKYPEDIKLIGCQNSPWAEAYDLTSLSEEEDIIVEKAMEALETEKPLDIIIEPKVIHRSSC